MRKDTFLLIVGLLVFATPLIHIPSKWEDISLFTLGFLIILVAFTCRLERRRRMRTSDSALHVEHKPERAVSAHDE